METGYTRRNTAAPYDEVRVIAARMAAYHDAAVAVSDLARQLRDTGAEVGGRWRSEEPYESWWSAAGKRNFLTWNAPTCDTDQSGFAWQSGEWVFVVVAPRGAFSSEVSREFPY